MQNAKRTLSFFMQETRFPDEAKQALLDAHAQLSAHPEALKRMQEWVALFNAHPGREYADEILDQLTALSAQIDVHAYMLHLLFFIYCTPALYQRYEQRGIAEDIYWNSMADLRYKLIECHQVYGIWGSFVAKWFTPFFSLERFALGRMQYEPTAFAHDAYTCKGFTLRRGDTVYNMHIPSAGPLTYQRRLDSYQKAFHFYKDQLGGGPLPVVCHSWLLYPENKRFYPPSSNLMDFMDDFDLIDGKASPTFEDAWRIFGAQYKRPLDQWPQDTALQRAYVHWLGQGNQTGSGFGVLLFDDSGIWQRRG